jgi:hypothetical protein
MVRQISEIMDVVARDEVGHLVEQQAAAGGFELYKPLPWVIWVYFALRRGSMAWIRRPYNDNLFTHILKSENTCAILGGN